MPNHHALVCFVRSIEDVPFDMVTLKENSELIMISLSVLGINDVRNLIKQAYQKPFEKPTQTFVLNIDQIAFEAQHALLKILEEPPESTRFVLVLRPETSLITTLLSRLYVIQAQNNRAIPASPEFVEFISATPANRLSLIARLTKDKDINSLNHLAINLTAWLKNNSANLSPALNTQILNNLILLTTRGAGRKMLWEDISLRLPSVR
jgi:DNA polymerase III gamma/tau subunit